MAAENTRNDIYDDLRSMVLTLDPDDLGLTKASFPDPVFALLMEGGFPSGSYTLVAIADGTTSIYFSGGGGVIGAGEHDVVRAVSDRFLAAAQELFQHSRPVSSFPKPDAGNVIFYFCTFDGVRAYTALQDDLEDRRDALSSLYIAGHDVITELRKLEENRDSRAQ